MSDIAKLSYMCIVLCSIIKNTSQCFHIVNQNNEVFFVLIQCYIDSTIMETLLSEHPRSDLCGG